MYSTNFRIKCIIGTILSIFVITALFPMDINAASKEKLSTPTLHIKKISSSKVALNWSKSAGASGYQIYKYDKSKKKYTLKKTIKSGEKLKWEDKKLNANTKYTYKIRAYKKDDKKKKYSDFTYTVSCITNTGSNKKVNASGINTKTSITVGLGVPYSVKGEAIVSKANNKKGKKVLDKKVRLFIPKTGHLKKDKKGRLVGMSTGKTTVYLRNHTGYVKKINVKVVDYAKPSKWKNLSRVYPEPRYVLNNYKKEITTIAAYFRNNPPKNVGCLYYDVDNTSILNGDKLKFSPIEKEVYVLLSQTNISIGVDRYGVSFKIPVGSSSYHEISYSFYEDSTNNNFPDVYIAIAPYWIYFFFIAD